jgi:hypothetical protein
VLGGKRIGHGEHVLRDLVGGPGRVEGERELRHAPPTAAALEPEHVEADVPDAGADRGSFVERVRELERDAGIAVAVRRTRVGAAELRQVAVHEGVGVRLLAVADVRSDDRRTAVLSERELLAQLVGEERTELLAVVAVDRPDVGSRDLARRAGVAAAAARDCREQEEQDPHGGDSLGRQMSHRLLIVPLAAADLSPGAPIWGTRRRDGSAGGE